MRTLWRLLQLLLGLAGGFLLGYGAVTWLIDQERRLHGPGRAGRDIGDSSAGRGEAGAAAGGGSDPAAPGALDGLWDKTLARFRLALEEGRRAAAAAKAELEAEIRGGASTGSAGPAL